MTEDQPERRPRVYLSGPVTKGDRNDNLHQAFTVHAALLKAGYAVLNPVASIAFPFAWEKWATHELWMETDLPWVEVADVVYRLPGESVGGDLEVAHAKKHGIPVVHDAFELAEWNANFELAS